MNPANIVDGLIRDIKERLTLDGKNRVFEEGKELSSEFMKEHYDFGVATDGLRWVFIDKNKEVVSDLNLETNYEQIRVFLVGKEKVISPKTEEEISKKFYDWYNALLHGGRYKDHENKQKTVSEADCLVNNIIGVKDWDDKEQIAQVVMNRLIFLF